MSQPSEGNVRVVIVGAGVVGTSAAYFLSSLAKRRNVNNVQVTLVDRVGVAAAASGRAGGFLCPSWIRGDVHPVAVESFELHKQFAKEFGESTIGFRRARACSGVAPQTRRTATSALSNVEKQWYSCRSSVREIATLHDAAQVVPERLVNEIAKASGADVIIGKPTRLDKPDKDDGKPMVMDIETAAGTCIQIECTHVIISAGPWSSDVASTLGVSISACYGELCHSILLHDDVGANALDPTCLFLDWRGREDVSDLELYSRVDGMYVSGNCEGPTKDILPPEAVSSSPQIASALKDAATSVGPSLGGYKLARSTACYLPICETGTLLVGAVPNTREKIYVGTGLTCWGIMNGPAVGRALAFYVLNGSPEKPEIWKPFLPI